MSGTRTIELDADVAEQLFEFVESVLSAQSQYDLEKEAWEREKAENWTPEIKAQQLQECRTHGDQRSHCGCMTKKASDLWRNWEAEGINSGNLATDEYTGDLSSHIAELGGQISTLERQLSIVKDGPSAETLRGPIREELAILQQEMDWAQSEAAAAAARKEVLRDALTETTGAPPVDGVTEASIRDALKKVRADAASEADKATGEAIKEALTPLTQAIHKGKERNLAPEVSARPEARPEPKSYEAAQPNVTVESSFESHPKIDVNVQVSMPISITRVQEVDNRAIAQKAGQQAGAATERAVRRSLDDAANVE